MGLHPAPSENATAILRDSSGTSGVSGVASLEAAAATATPACCHQNQTFKVAS